MNRLWVASAAVLCVALTATQAADEPKSGLQVGESTSPYNVRDITGPNAGKTLCYRWQYAARPVVNIFAREITDDLTSLVKAIDDKVGANKSKNMAAFVVILTDDSDKAETKLKALAKDKAIKNTPLTIMEGAAGPKPYNIAKEADVTVMLWVNGKVEANHAFPKGKLDKAAIDKIVADTGKILK